MIARALAVTFAVQLELPYDVGQAHEECRSCGASRSVGGVFKTHGVSKPTGDGKKTSAHRFEPVHISSISTSPWHNYV